MILEDNKLKTHRYPLYRAYIVISPEILPFFEETVHDPSEIQGGFLRISLVETARPINVVAKVVPLMSWNLGRGVPTYI